MTFTRRPIIAGNWKLNLTSTEGKKIALEIASGVDSNCPEVVLFPTFLAATSVSELLADSVVEVGVQDIYWESWGAFTGEISPLAVISEGLKWTLVGHSERRKYFSESDSLLAHKAQAALKSGLKVIFCIGETLEAREAGNTFEVLTRQLLDGVLCAAPELHKNLVIAYEPIWAIGTGKTASPEIAQEAHGFIRELLSKHAGKTASEEVRILYGGSVKSKNIASLMSKPDIDGGLVGGASLNTAEFLKIIRYKE